MRFLLLPLLFLSLLSTGGLSASEKIPLRIAYLAKVHYAPVIIAISEGLFSEAGIEVTPVVVGPGSGILAAEALATGAADAAAMGDGPAIISSSRDPLPLILCAYISAERQHRFVAGPGISIQEPGDLRGRSIAVHHGSSTFAGLQLFFAHHGIETSQVTLINLNPVDMAAALASRQSDVAIASDPIPDYMLQQVEGSSPAGDLAGLGTDFPYLVLTTRSWASRYPQGPERISKALRAATEIINEDRPRAIALVAAVTGDSLADTERWMELCEWEIRSPSLVIDGMQKLAEAMFNSGRLSRPAQLKESMQGISEDE